MKHKIIGTGSDGNSFLFEDSLIIDLGLSYKKMTESLGIDIGKIKWVLLTHIHGDHFNQTAIRKMFVNTQATFICGEWLKDKLINLGIDDDRIMIVECGKVYELDDFKISPILAYHDVENCGYRIVLKGHKHIHITDTYTIDGINAISYDSATIECNHCEVRAIKIIKEAKENGEFSHLSGAMASHLSVQQTMAFCKENKIKKLIPVHIGGSTRKEVLLALGVSK